jgi:copper chaperone CopZ
MTYLEATFRYQTTPGENELRAIDTVREVYGIQRIQFNEKERTVRVTYDASRLNADAVVKLLRQADMDIQDQIVVA